MTDSTPRAHRTDQASPPQLGTVTLPPLSGPLNTLWDVILDVAVAVPAHRWALIGGQMVTLHALHSGRPPLRVSRDIDVLADLLTGRDGLALCVTAIRALDLLPDEVPSGRIHRFTRARDGVSVDVVAPDHTPPTWSLRTAKGHDTIQIAGGRQALQRSTLITVTKDDRSAHVPVPICSAPSCSRQRPGWKTAATRNATAMTPPCSPASSPTPSPNADGSAAATENDCSNSTPPLRIHTPQPGPTSANTDQTPTRHGRS